jgi:hypothetical protein
MAVLAFGWVVTACGGESVPSSTSGSATSSIEPAASSTSPATPAATTVVVTTPTTATPPDPLTVAEEWLAAYETGDVTAFQALMHSDATARCVGCAYERREEPYFAQVGEGTSDLSDSRLLALANGTIERSCAADGSVVSCDTVRRSDFGHRDDEGMPTLQFTATYEFTVEDGLITRRILILHSGQTFDFNVVADYERWLRDNHPDAHEQLFAFGTILVTTVEQFEAHREYVPRFLASL